MDENHKITNKYKKIFLKCFFSEIIPAFISFHQNYFVRFRIKFCNLLFLKDNYNKNHAQNSTLYLRLQKINKTNLTVNLSINHDKSQLVFSDFFYFEFIQEKNVTKQNKNSLSDNYKSFPFIFCHRK